MRLMNADPSGAPVRATTTWPTTSLNGSTTTEAALGSDEIVPGPSAASTIIGGVSFDHGLLAPILGRDDDLGRLADLTGLPDNGAEPTPGSAMILVSGDAGIGKSRVVREIVDRAEAANWRVLVGHCLGESGSAMPYLPFTEMLSRLQAEAPEAMASLIAAHPQTAAVLAGRTPRAESTDRAEVIAGLQAAFEHLALDAPVLAVVEDVHWADQSSRDLLTLLFTRGFTGPVTLLVTYRSDDLHRRHPLRSTLAMWSRLPQLRRLDLGPLDSEPMRELVRRVQPEGLADDDVEEVVERAEGNAFFAEELALASAAGRGAGDDLSRLLLVRFEQLEPEAQTVVRIASAAGRQVGHALLERVAALPSGTLDIAVRSAVEHHILLLTQSGYEFRHALLAETVYDDLLPGERVRIHQAYADALTSSPELGSNAALARHAERAGDRQRTLTASVAAGEDAMAVGGPDEAYSHFVRALGLLACDDPENDRITLKAAAAAEATGQLDKAVALLQDRLPRSTSVLNRIEILGTLAQLVRVTELPVDGLALTTEAMGLLPADASPTVRLRTQSHHVQALIDQFRHDEAVRLGEEVLDDADRLNQRELISELRTMLTRVYERAGDARSSQLSLEAVIASAKPGLPAVRAYHHLGYLHLREGRFPEAVATFNAGVAMAEQLGRPWAPYAFECRLLAGVVGYEAGQWDESLRTLTDPRPGAGAIPRALLTAGRMYVQAGRGEASAMDALPHLRPLWPSEGMIAVISGSAAIDLYGYGDDLDRARRTRVEAITVLEELWETDALGVEARMNAYLLGHLARAAGRVGARERALLLQEGELLADRAAHVHHHAIEMGQARVEAIAWSLRAEAERARLRWLAGGEAELDELAELWRGSVAAFVDYPNVYEQARSRARLAEVLHAAGDPGARTEVETAMATARSLRAAPLIEELRSLTGRGATRAASRTAEQLTPRESEILTLVALGRTNKQIGSQLFISAKTASVHVSNILAKLGASGRVEAAAIARDRGLID